MMLDEAQRVLYSTPDSTMLRTGIQSGMGFPELCLDSSHADILVGCAGASMRKLRKTDKSRDVVPAACLRVKAVCDALLPIATSTSFNRSNTEELDHGGSQAAPAQGKCRCR